MTDWKALFELSSAKYHGKTAAKIYEVTKEDTKWLETTIKQFKFEQSDSLKKAIDQLKEQSQIAKDKLNKKTNANELSVDDFDELFENIKELVELNAANNISLANMGGVQALLELIVAHKEDSVRK